METVVQTGVSVQDALWKMASGETAKFAEFFRKVRKVFPIEVTTACLSYIGQKGLDLAGRDMAFWLALETKCFKVLFDNTLLGSEIAWKATAELSKADPQFLTKFQKEADLLTGTAPLLRALSLAPAAGDYGSKLFPWLKKLTSHTDDRVRSKAVKLLCEIRPNKIQVEKQMLDTSARVRANAIEALWNSKTGEATEIFQAALGDTNHRVVGNALVGLYLQGDAAAFHKITELCESPLVPTRSAMAWCLGFIRDERGIEFLQLLSKDPSPIVRKRASRSLLALQPAETTAA